MTSIILFLIPIDMVGKELYNSYYISMKKEKDMKSIYFDNAATTRLDDEVLQEMLPYLKENYGNASSIYKLGRESRKAVEESRERIAKVLNCKPNEIYFTAGGSESDNTAIKGIAKSNKKKGNHIITSKIEHPAVLETCKQLEKEGFEITYISVDENGIVDLEELKKSIKPTTILITIIITYYFIKKQPTNF